ncbi:hypothetical protein [Aquimarina muelleri]|uniref:Thioredoxin domain-containing protein n=1 Tax=Aquimarina muelleri TaxID=279356 RepID=A0A918K0J5_9FLAO|nr:hypothetical protein [Aquimarina muelleri]MCX2764920.1 hypothetical protein [Aquimarina muelleri]GGX30640.1 hypothetical protein GCM10007384_34690 [Aquimarina muelleri]
MFSCSTPEKSNRKYTYFGGEIVNPNTNYVILSKNSDYDDTIFLDRNNRFMHKIENQEEGLYYFKHNPENQVILLEKGDSILIRLNTLEFDESLVFTGDGAAKNNFLIDLFLQDEIEREELRRTDFRLSTSLFKKKQDSLLNLKLITYKKLVKRNNLSNLAKKITQASLIFDYYTRHELYFNRRYEIGGINATKRLSTSFFSYRNKINFNDEELKRSYSFHRFLNYYFINASLSNYANKLSKYNNQSGSTLYKLDLIDSMIKHPYIKNNLLRRFTTNFLLDSKNDYESDKVLKHYQKISSNKKSKMELKNLARSISKLRPNKIIPNQDLITSKGETVKLSSLFKKPITALYFWSMESKDHYVKAHKKTAYLSTIYPNIDFIAINTDSEQEKNWLKTIKRHRYNLDYEYEFKYPKCSSEELVIHYRNKVILVNQEGKIINPNTDLFASLFEKQLMQYTQLSSLEN